MGGPVLVGSSVKVVLEPRFNAVRHALLGQQVNASCKLGYASPFRSSSVLGVEQHQETVEQLNARKQITGPHDRSVSVMFDIEDINVCVSFSLGSQRKSSA